MRSLKFTQYPTTGWFEIHQYDDKKSVTVANIVEQDWQVRYPWSAQLILAQGIKFIGKSFKKKITVDYSITGKPKIVLNPQANQVCKESIR